jgi:hypothetical protein
MRLVALPATLRAIRGGQPDAPKLGSLAVELVTGLAVALFSLSLLTMVLLASESFFTRQGRFSGAGAVIVWPPAMH